MTGAGVDGATATAGGGAAVDPVTSGGVVMVGIPGTPGDGAAALRLGSRGAPRPPPGGGSGTTAFGEGLAEGAAAGGFSRAPIASVGACRAPRRLVTSWNVPSTSSRTPMPIISGRRRLEI